MYVNWISMSPPGVWEDCTFYITRRHRQQAGIRAGVASAQFPLWREETIMCHTFHRSFSPCLVSLQTQQATGVLISDSQPIATLLNAFLKPCTLLQIFVPDF